MRLEEITNHMERQCYLCRLADMNPHGVVWPLEPVLKPEPIHPDISSFGSTKVYRPQRYSLGMFLLYCDIHNTLYPHAASAKRRRDLCYLHYHQMYQDWEHIARLEVTEYNAWAQWLERTE